MTAKPSSVRLARPGDEELLFALICASEEDWSLGARDPDKIRRVIWSAISDTPPPRPVFGVIQGPTVFEGVIGLFPTEPWNSSDLYLRAFLHFVHPMHRKTRHAVDLRDFARWFGEVSGVPVMFELPHSERTEGRARMFERGSERVGDLFIYRPEQREAVAA